MSATARICPQCRAVNDAGEDFCRRCGEYLAWGDPPEAPTEAQGVAGAPSPQAVPEIDLEVTAKGGAGADGTPLVVEVAPGRSAEVRVRIRNAGPIVDGYSVGVVGLPSAWVTVPSRRVQLLPIGTQGTYEGEVTLIIAVPRSPEATAGEHPFTVVAEAVSRQRNAASRAGVLKVGRFDALVVSVRPHVVERRRRAAFVCDIRSGGNAPVAPTVSVVDEKEKCRCLVDGKRGNVLGAIAPGATGRHRITARAGWRLIGPPRDHPLTVIVHVEGLEQQPPPQSVVFRQNPLIPLWLPALLVTLGILAVAVFALLTLRPRDVVVPALKGRQSAFAAQRDLAAAKFKNPPVVKIRVRAQPAPGTVVDQAPAAGLEVPPDTVVTLVVAGAPTTTIIPDLIDRRFRRVDALLTRAHLVLGKVRPSEKARRRVVSQSPRPGVVRNRGTAVHVVLAGPGLVRVPRVRCLKVADAEKKLSAQGLKPSTLPNFVGAGRRVLGQIPSARTKRRPGTRVTLLFKGDRCKPLHPKKKQAAKKKKRKKKKSARNGAGQSSGAVAPPGLTYEDGNVLRIGASRLAAGGTEPAWSPGGQVLAYRTGDHDIVLREGRAGAVVGVPRHPQRWPRVGLALLAAGPGTTLAFLEARSSGTALCLLRVRPASGARPSCRGLGPLVPLGIAAAPGGREMVVVAARHDDPARPGVLRLVASRAGSSRARDWASDGRLVRPGPRGAVFDAAYSPDGAALALATGAAGRTPHVVLASARGLPSLAGARRTRTAACQVAFDPRGDRLAVVAPIDGACSPSRRPGRLVVVPVGRPGRPQVVARLARDPSWRRGGQP